jgi:uncharacterized integral membrane protein (TIGR00698 family)
MAPLPVIPHGYDLSAIRGLQRRSRAGESRSMTDGAHPEPPDPPAARRAHPVRRLLPGLALSLAVALAATAAGRAVPLAGGPVAGIVLGVLCAGALGRRRRGQDVLHPGLAFASGRILRLSVALVGFRLSAAEVVRVGAGSLPVMLGTLAACLATARFAGRRLGVSGNLRTLIGVGTGVCGASAIAATAPVIGAAGAEVAYAMSTVFVFNIAAVLAFPLVGHLLGMGQQAFGLFAGTAVNDTSSVVAAAASYGPLAADHAVVVKLARTLMIIPICLALARRTRRRDGAAPVRPAPAVPGFLVGFLLAAAAHSAGLVPDAARHGLDVLTGFLVTAALSAIGLSTDLGALRRAGPRPLLLGACLWLVVSATSLAVQFMT